MAHNKLYIVMKNVLSKLVLADPAKYVTVPHASLALWSRRGWASFIKKMFRLCLDKTYTLLNCTATKVYCQASWSSLPMFSGVFTTGNPVNAVHSCLYLKQSQQVLCSLLSAIPRQCVLVVLQLQHLHYQHLHYQHTQTC